MTIKLGQHQSQRHSPPPHLRRANTAPSSDIRDLCQNGEVVDDRRYVCQLGDEDSPLIAVVPTDEDKTCDESPTTRLRLKKRRNHVSQQELSQSAVVSDDEYVGIAKSHIQNKRKKKKSVKFCNPLVTKVMTRPYTNPLDIPKLFYSASDEARFRAAAHEERQSRRSVVSKAIVVHNGAVHTYRGDDNAFLDDPKFWNGTVTWY